MTVRTSNRGVRERSSHGAKKTGAYLKMRFMRFAFF